MSDIIKFIGNNTWMIYVVLSFYIIYIITCIVLKVLKKEKVNVDMLYETLKKIPKIMSQAELIFPHGSGPDKLSYCTNLIKVLISEVNPNSYLLTYNWDALVQEIFNESQKINAKEENKKNA